MAINGNSQRQRFELRNRYLFTGKLVMKTALHIGGGRATLSGSDSPVVLTPDQKPFIPGSSFKGALRSTVEKIVPSLPASAELRTCALIEYAEEEIEQKFTETDLWPDGVCPTGWQAGLTRLRRKFAGQEREKELVKAAQRNLCQTCQLFGSPFAAARLNVDDLYLPSSEDWSGAVQTRDGVAIDRDSEKAKDRLKYDFEVVPASATFDVRIMLENATVHDLQLLCVGLSEYVHGFGAVGGKRSRGLGVGQLENLHVSALELDDPATRNQHLRDYLARGTFSREIDGPEFLEEQIGSLFE